MSGDDQLSLFTDPGEGRLPDRLGHALISSVQVKSILTRASGFMDAYDFTLNPYSGCSFGCTYCYAAFFSRSKEKQDTWGQWVDVKTDAVARLKRMRTPLEGARIYMSSVTDPYQPIERHARLVRELLEVLVERQPRLVVQTRSPLVTRDLDLFHQLDVVRVNMTVTTDDEDVRRTFEPWCSPNDSRLRAIAAIAAAGIPTSITMTPLLPVSDPTSFARALLDTGVTDFVIQPFHTGRSRFVAGTREQATSLMSDRGWDDNAYAATVRILRQVLPRLVEGRDGFAPP